MRSSTFSSKKQWIITYIGAALFLVIIISTLEFAARQYGYTPTVVDDEKLWALEDKKVGTKDREIVLTGSSRMLTDISIPALLSCFPGYSIINLAIDGSCPNHVIEHLSSKEAFRGIVLVDFREECLFFGHEDELAGKEFISFSQNAFNWNHELNRRIATFFQKRMVIIDPYMNVFKYIGTIFISKNIRRPRYWRTDENRSQWVDYSVIDTDKFLQSKEAQSAIRDEKFTSKKEISNLDRNIEILKKSVTKIKQRGGEVIFVRLPLDSAGWTHDELFFPRIDYWDTVCNYLDVKQIHFKDYDEMQNYRIVDHSHIEGVDKNRLTLKVAEIIRKILYK